MNILQHWIQRLFTTKKIISLTNCSYTGYSCFCLFQPQTLLHCFTVVPYFFFYLHYNGVFVLTIWLHTHSICCLSFILHYFMLSLSEYTLISSPFSFLRLSNFVQPFTRLRNFSCLITVLESTFHKHIQVVANIL